MTKKLFLLSLFSILFSSAVFSQAMAAPVYDIDDEYYKYNNPFEYDLDTYKYEMDSGATILLGSVIGVIGFSLLGSLFRTGESAGWFGENITDVMVTTSWIGGLAASGTAVWGFVRWKNGADDYYETLRLQTQYYNLISQ